MVAFTNKEYFGDFKSSTEVVFLRVSKLVLAGKIGLNGLVQNSDLSIGSLWTYIYYLYRNNVDSNEIFQSMQGVGSIKKEEKQARAFLFYKTVQTYLYGSENKNLTSSDLIKFVNKIYGNYPSLSNPIIENINDMVKNKTINIVGLKIQKGDNEADFSFITNPELVEDADIKIRFEKT